MKKLALTLDELKVESFTTDSLSGEKGTVEGASLPTRPLCSQNGGCNSYKCETVTCTVEWCC